MYSTLEAKASVVLCNARFLFLPFYQSLKRRICNSPNLSFPFCFAACFTFAADCLCIVLQSTLPLHHQMYKRLKNKTLFVLFDDVLSLIFIQLFT